MESATVLDMVTLINWSTNSGHQTFPWFTLEKWPLRVKSPGMCFSLGYTCVIPGWESKDPWQSYVHHSLVPIVKEAVIIKVSHQPHDD